MSIGIDPFTSREGRPAPAVGQRVRVYRNLPLFKHQVFSILAMDGPFKGMVLGYSRHVGLSDARFIVSEKTRQTVLKKNRRTVHAYCEGRVIGYSPNLPEQAEAEDAALITYNPFQSGHFHLRDAVDKPVATADEIWTCGANLIAPKSYRSLK